MKILSTAQVKEADNYTITNEPILSIDLMERAASRAADWIMENIGLDNDFVIFAGPGNNGGDGLVIARRLDKAMRDSKLSGVVTVYVVKFTDKFSPDFRTNLERLNRTNVRVVYLTEGDQMPLLEGHEIVIDAIFGSGLSRPVRGFPAKVIEHINQSPKQLTIAVDVPSGLFGEENHKEEQTIIKADITLTFEFPFLSFFFPENQDYVGEFVVIPIGIHPDYIANAPTDYFTVEFEQIASMIKPRKKFSHKGNYGHGLLIAGSYGRMGAAVLAARAAHRAGIGLLTAHLPAKCVDVMQVSSPETMISIDQISDSYSGYAEINEKYTAIGFGPAVGLTREPALLLDELISGKHSKPMVLDADALTIIAQHKWLDRLPGNTIITPHPKEFERIAGETSNNYQRLQLQRKIAKEHKIIVVLKGAYTSICFPDGKCYFNTTGNPGMAAGGSGDVLTGIILSLLAQGYSPKEAALAGVYLHGLAADIAADETGYHALIPSDIINRLSEAYILLTEGDLLAD